MGRSPRFIDHRALTCMQCDRAVDLRDHYEINTRPWCAGCAEPYRPHGLRTIGASLSAVAKLAALVVVPVLVVCGVAAVIPIRPSYLFVGVITYGLLWRVFPHRTSDGMTIVHVLRGRRPQV